MLLFRFLWRKKGWLIFLGLVMTGTWFYLNRAPVVESPYETEAAAPRTIVQEVSVTGSIEPTAKITLRFPLSGTLDIIRVEEGDLVSKGDELMRLDDEDLDLAVTSAEADLSSAKAEYAKASTGSSAEAIAVAQAAVDKAEADLTQAENTVENEEELGNQAIALAELDYESAVSDYDNLVKSFEQEVDHTYENALLAIDDALTAGENAFMTLDNILAVEHETSDPSLLAAVSAHNSAYYTGAVNTYKSLNATYESVAEELHDFETESNEAIQTALDTTTELLDDVTALIDDVDELLNDAPALQGFDEDKRQEVRAELSEAKQTLLAQRSELQTQGQAVETVLTEQSVELASARWAVDQAEEAIQQAALQKETSVASAEAAVDVTESLLSQAKASLAEVKAGPRSVDLAPYLSAIDRAEAQLEIARYNRTRSSLVSPIEGIVTEVYVEEGESLGSADNVIQLITTTSHILANIPESDISKIAVGNVVTMTLDAFAFDEIFEGEVVEIDTAETVVDGVIYYQVKAEFTLDYPGIKSGMTANMDILTAEAVDTLAIPLRALKYDEDRIYVEVLDAETSQPVEVEVKLGIRDDQYVQVLSGLEAGDPVITLTHETL